MLRRVLAGWCRCRATFDAPTLTTAANLAATRRSTGDYAGARELFERVLERSRAILGEDRPITVAARDALSALDTDVRT
ncbi:tetratricopeptide repeat protein [Frankia sp. EI5c]|uniref:tetratricopeptide repeat protein n=1 Tax=Frankia sp. EI5c TaxID=683316 RepID=UPI000AC014C5|nr:tetratricopeptide repeat protein [Frankia sp. EI5c]